MTIKAQLGGTGGNAERITFSSARQFSQSTGRPTTPQRIDRDQLYMEVAQLFAKRSTCLRGQVGCVAVRDNHIVCAGYNGAPAGMLHCLEVGCGGGVWEDGSPVSEEVAVAGRVQGDPRITFPNGCTRSIHGEVNMVAYAARHGIPLEGACVYATAGPCLPCAQALVGAGIVALVYGVPYRLPEGLQLVDKANIKVVHYGG